MNDQKRRRLLLLPAVGIALCGLGALAYGNIGANLVYFWEAQDVIEAGDKAIGATIRLGGLVAANSVNWMPETQELEFTVTDATGAYLVPVHAKAAPPQMFREGIGVVIEGTMTEVGTFECDRVMVKHSNEYKAPVEGTDPKELYETLQEQF
jgi:cytochrome c-type biogenesis protein CcmE